MVCLSLINKTATIQREILAFFLNKNYIYNPCSFVIIGWFKHYDNDDEHENDTQQALSFIKDDITRLVQD